MRQNLLTLALAFAATSAFAADRYEFDTNHRNVRFTFNHFGFSNISGSFEQLDGHVMLDTADLTKSSVEVTIPIASIHTGVPKFDEHLKSADFFEAAKFANATFKSTGVTSSGEGKLAVAGDLTMHGVTKPVTLDVTVNKLGEHPMAKAPWAGFDATTTIKRTDFGLGLYAPNVSDDVKITISVELKGPAPAKS